MSKDTFAEDITEGLAPVEITPEPAAPVAASAPTPTPAPSPAPQAPAPAEPPKAQEAIPLATALDWRDQLKATKRELDELKAKSAVAPAVPSAHEDSVGFAAHVQEQVQRALINERFANSEESATDKYGKDTVEAAKAWALEKSETEARSSPLGISAFAAEYCRQANPIAWAVRQHKRDLTFKDIGDDPDAYITREAARLGFVKAQAAPTGATPQPAAPPQPQPTAPTRSLASAPAAGGGQNSVPSHPTAAVDAVFN